jgi:hypothetical protein
MWFLCGTNWISLSFCSGYVMWFPWGTNWISLSFCSGDVIWFPWSTNWISLSFCSVKTCIIVILLRASVLVNSGKKSEITAVGDPPLWSCDTPLSAKVSWPTSGSRSVGIVRSRTKATELVGWLSQNNVNGWLSWWSLVSCHRHKLKVKAAPVLN